MIDNEDMLIANFMECEFHDDGRVQFTTNVDDYVTENPMWDTSWDWLMLVVEKCTKIIENYGYDEDDRNHIEDEIFNLDYTLSEFLNNDKESIYARVVEFIKWYNK